MVCQLVSKIATASRAARCSSAKVVKVSGKTQPWKDASVAPGGLCNSSRGVSIIARNSQLGRADHQQRAAHSYYQMTRRLCPPPEAAGSGVTAAPGNPSDSLVLA